MSEDEARDWLRVTFGTDAFERLERFANLLLNEAERQSLIARSTFGEIWSRHIADSAQLVRLAPTDGRWLDVGSGGGLPGLVVALIRDAPLTMVEPRRKRTDFLTSVCAAMNISNASVICGNLQSVTLTAAVLSARAVAGLTEIFEWARFAVSRETLFILPRGQNASADLESARSKWHGRFHVEQSITDPAAGIVIATEVQPR